MLSNTFYILLIALLFTFGVSSQVASNIDTAAGRLAGGTWELVAWDVEYENGTKVQPWGTDFIGRIFYTSDKSIITNIMRKNRPLFANSTGPFDGALEERAAAYLTDVAYGGNFVITEYNPCSQKGTVLHFITQAWYPGWVGTIQVRYFEFVGDYLVISTDFGSIIPGDMQNRQILTWLRKSL